MTRVRAAAAVAGTLLIPLFLAGCGIKTTGVIESGDPARVSVNSPARMPVSYFVTPDAQLVPSPQGERAEGAANSVLTRLLFGPGEAEKAAGLRTELPQLDTKQIVSARIELVATDAVRIRVPFAVEGLSQLARRQLVCTVRSTFDPAVSYRFSIRGPDATLDSLHCEADG